MKKEENNADLDDDNDDTANVTVEPVPINRFISVSCVELTVALREKCNGSFGIWKADKSVVEPNYNFAISVI